jgi:ABC-2 type transport system permease protein
VVKVHVDAGGLGLSEVLQSLDANKAGALIQIGMAFIAVSLNTVMLLVTAFYLLDCLYAERKDRSILFWKSLPVSDLSIVGSKLMTAALVIPLVTLVIFAAVAVCMYLITGVTMLFSGTGLFLSAGPLALAEVVLTHAYALTVQSLWYLPIFGWLLLVSAWSKRAVLLWAILPPVAVQAAESLVLGTAHFAGLLKERLIGVYPLAFANDSHQQLHWQYEGEHADVDLEFSDGLLALVEPGMLLGSPGLWGGLIVAAVFFSAAVWVRRFRDES